MRNAASDLYSTLGHLTEGATVAENMKMQQARHQSRAFLIAFERCIEQRPLPGGQYEMLAVPAVVCLAFSVELGFKALALAAGGEPWGHSLAGLLGDLPEELRARLAAAVGGAREDFDAALAAATNTFTDWRYVHENASAFANIEFLRALARAVQKAADGRLAD